MSIKYKLLILCFLSLNICVGQNSNVDFETYFSDIEIQDLNNIADFFQCELCGTKKRKEFGRCIRDLIPEILDHKYIDRNINYHKQKKLYRGISKSTFDKIWTLCKTWRTNEPKYEYKSLCFSGNKMFKEFVLELGKRSGYLLRYGRNLAGNMGNDNYIASNVIQFPKSMNLDDRGVQIVFAIHYLTLNDNLKRVKKAIRLEKRDLRKLKRSFKEKN